MRDAERHWVAHVLFSTMELMGVTVVRTIHGQYQSKIIITTITPIKATFCCHFIDPLIKTTFSCWIAVGQYLFWIITVKSSLIQQNIIRKSRVQSGHKDLD